MHNICDFHFIFGLCVLKIILSNTNGLSKFLQSKEMDVYTAREQSFKTIEALKKCRNEDDFSLIWQMAELLSKEIENIIVNTDFSIKPARISRKQGLQEGSMTPESHHRIFTYYAALDKVELQLKTRLGSNDHEILFSLGDIILKDNPKEKSFSTVCSFYDLDEELLKADFRVFKIIKEQDKSLNFTKATEVYESLGKDVNMLPELEKIIRIYTVIPSTTATAERSFSGLRRTKT